jgi:cytochrome c oxidase subunit 1
MLGAKDVAFPKINLLSWYIFILGGSVTLWALASGGVDTGWTFYTPFSTTFSNTHVITAALGIFIAGFSSILTGLNFIVTIHRMRAPGLTWFRLPLFVWALYATSLIQVLGTPVIAITIVLVALERAFHIGVFDPAYGGDPVLFQHMFWFYSHPAVYIMILPGMGVISELISTFSRKPIFGYKFVAFSSLAIAVFGFIVWSHHMFVAGISVYAAMVASFLSFAVAIPSAIKTFNWAATMYKGSISYRTPMLYAFGFLGLFAIGGLTGLFLATLGLDVHLHDTYFIIAHFHYIMVGGMVMAYLGGIHYWWPKITGRMYPEPWAKLSAMIVFVGFNLTFFPQFILGYMGMPRRYGFYPPEWQVLHVLSTAGASILAVGYLLPAIYLLYSLRYGEVAGDNPWGASTLEWQTSSPPPLTNFVETPVVTTEAYHYTKEQEAAFV